MKILMIATEFPPAKGYGLARYTRNLAQALSKLGAQVHVLSINYLEGKEHYFDGDVKIHLVTELLPFKSFSWVSGTVLDNIRIVERGIQIMEKERFDVISIHDWLAALTGKTLKKIYGTPLVLTLHDTEVGKRNNKLTAEQHYIAELEEFIVNESPAIITNSSFMKNEIAKTYKVDKKRIHKIPCAVNPKEFETSCDLKDFKNIFAPSDTKIVLFVGRLSPMKGPQYLLEAASEVVKAIPKVKYIFAGSGVLQQPLLQDAKKCGLENHILFPGHLTGKVLAAMYRIADCLVVPSTYEPFGMVALEGMICETPVIASDVGGLAEIFDDENVGITIPPKNSQLLAKNIIRVLQDGTLASNIVSAAKEKCCKWTWDNVAKETISVYEELSQ